VLEPEALQAAVLAAAGELQALMNQLGLAARSAPTAKLVFDSDLRASLRRSLQFGRSEFVSVESPLGKRGVLAEPSDVVVAARSRIPQLAVEVRWHPRGEDHAGFVQQVMWDIAKLALARTRESVEQAVVLIAAPGKFWRWLPGYSEDRAGYQLLDPDPEIPASAKSDFLAAPEWDAMFAGGMDEELPDRLWTQLLGVSDIRSPWADAELRNLEVKGLGTPAPVRG
jgi:hypothetical protein